MRDRNDFRSPAGRPDREDRGHREDEGQPSYGHDWGSSGTSHYGRSDYPGWRGYGGQRGYGNTQRDPGPRGPAYGQYDSYGQRGVHRGKGPKGYQRTDERLRELICERLSEDPEIDPGDVSITVASSRVTLEGSVDSRRTKNAIEDIVEQFDVSDVQNNLRVSREAVSSSQSDWERTARASDASKQKRN
jgi:hypothetical protein